MPSLRVTDQLDVVVRLLNLLITQVFASRLDHVGAGAARQASMQVRMLPVGGLARSIAQIIGHDNHMTIHDRDHLVIEKLERGCLLHVERPVLDAEQMVVRGRAPRNGHDARGRQRRAVNAGCRIFDGRHIDITQQVDNHGLGQVYILPRRILRHHGGDLFLVDMPLRDHAGQVVIALFRTICPQRFLLLAGRQQQQQQQRQQPTLNIPIHSSVR